MEVLSEARGFKLQAWADNEVYIRGVVTVGAQISQQEALTWTLTFCLFDPVTVETHTINLQQIIGLTRHVQMMWSHPYGATSAPLAACTVTTFKDTSFPMQFLVLVFISFLTFVQCPWSSFHCDSVTLILSYDVDDDDESTCASVIMWSVIVVPGYRYPTDSELWPAKPSFYQWQDISCLVHTTLSVTGAFLPPDPVCGTFWQQTYDFRRDLVHSSGNSKPYCLVVRDHSE